MIGSILSENIMIVVVFLLILKWSYLFITFPDTGGFVFLLVACSCGSPWLTRNSLPGFLLFCIGLVVTQKSVVTAPRFRRQTTWDWC